MTGINLLLLEQFRCQSFGGRVFILKRFWYSEFSAFFHKGTKKWSSRCFR